MKKLNNKGFAISTIFYSIIIIAVLIMAMLYSTLIFRKKSSNDFVDIMENNLNQDSIIWSTCALYDTDEVAKVGDVVKCGLENFHIIEVNDMEVYLLADNVLAGYSNGEIKQLSGGNSALISIQFSFTAYWTTNGSNVNANYGTKYPAFVFDENSGTMYQYVKKYQDYLRNTLLINTANVTLINLEQADSIGLKTASGSIIGEWVKIDKKWYTGVATQNSKIYSVDGETLVAYSYSQGGIYMRPVVRISKKSLN